MSQRSSYFSTLPEPTIPYRPLWFADITLRLLGSDDFRVPHRGTPAARGARASHELVEQGAGGRVVLEL